MAIKTRIKELCPRCGQVQAVPTAAGIRRGHACPTPVPGPQSPPYMFPWSEAYFIDGTGREYFSYESCRKVE